METASTPPTPRWLHVVAVGLLFAALAVRFSGPLSSAVPLGDELAQERAYRELVSGSSPYAHGGYVYPPSLLRIHEGLRALPLPSPFLPLRLGSLLGLSLLLWTATQELRLRPAWRWLLALAFGSFAPGAVQGIEFGNLSFLVGGLIFASLAIWELRPWRSGVLLGSSLLVKPLALGAITALFWHRPAHRMRHRFAALAAAAFAAALLLPDPEFGAFLARGSSSWELHRSASIYRLLALVGAPEAAPALLFLLLAATAICAWRWVRTARALTALAAAAIVTATPVVWNHTLVLTAPLQAMALALASQRLRAAKIGDRRERWWEVTLVGLGVAALIFGEGVTGIDDRSVALQLFALLPPAVAPAALAAYVLRGEAAETAGSRTPARKSS